MKNLNNKKLSKNTREKVILAIDKGIDNYIKERKSKIPDFVNTHFTFNGTLKLHKKALGKDLYRTPLNIFWSVPYLMIRISAGLLNKIGKKDLSLRLTRIPRGLRTDMENEIKWLIYTELLEIPFEQSGKVFLKDALLESILSQKEVVALMVDYLSEIKNKSENPEFRSSLEKKLKEYTSSRVAVSDIAGSIITIAASYFTFNKAVPGVFSAGNITAATIAQQIAISNFWLGSNLGAIYYGIFPAAPSMGLIMASTGAIMTALALLSSFIGIITDPIQVKLGIHKKRLNKFIDMFQSELKGTGKSEYKIKDHYLARVFDIIDLLKVAARSI
jgi:hypothetical protein